MPTLTKEPGRFCPVYTLYFMRIRFCSLALLAVGCTSPSDHLPTDQVQRVEVAGIGQVTAYPNQAEVTVEASFIKPRLKDAAAEVQGVIGDVMTAIKPFVSSSKDVKTSFISTNKEYNYIKGKQVFAGFQATQSLTVRLADLTKLEDFMEKLLTTRISRIQHLTYSHTQADSLQQEAQLIALRNSLKAADKLCAELGCVDNRRNLGRATL